jgi:ferredoxin
MWLITEEQIKKLKEAGVRFPTVSYEWSTACIWCSVCVAVSSNVFDLNDDGFSVVKELDNYEDQEVDNAIMACPVNAISWVK